MILKPKYSFKKIIAQLLLLALPLVIFVSYGLFNLNKELSLLHETTNTQILMFAVGVLGATLFYGFRFRVFITIALTAFIVYTLQETAGLFNLGEFDGFLISTRVTIFSILFFVGWLVGLGIARWRYFPIAFSFFCLALQIISISRLSNFNYDDLINAIIPLAVFAIYFIYTAELIRNYQEEEKPFIFFLIKRITPFALLVIAALFLTLLVTKGDVQDAVFKYGKGNNKNKKGEPRRLTKDNADSTISSRDMMALDSSIGRKQMLMFVAKLDNYFEDGTPNPLYFNAYYYTKFDEKKQALATDSLMPDDDLFKPNPATIPLYFSKEDTSVLRKAKGKLKRKIISADVYKVNLAKSEFVAPSTAFFCQPIAIDKSFKQQFTSAYRAKMFVSELNSAYFTYMPPDKYSLIALFQELRFAQLRKVKNYAKEDSAFMKYYTYVPKGSSFDSINTLAKGIMGKETMPIDKIIALRDFFLKRDSTDKRIFSYNDNPGIPGLPEANKLSYFLFKNQKGYCAYYAAATMIMLRSVGLPTRVAGGFLTEDRSNKNKGWYWFYEKQAHAWVQVFFPGYGWIDFDTTVPDDERAHGPQPDGTPPVTAQPAAFITKGIIQSIDTATKTISILADEMMIDDNEFKIPKKTSLQLDISLAAINNDTGTISIKQLQKGLLVVAVSYAEKFKKLNVIKNENINSVLKKLPDIIPIDEIVIANTEKKKEAEKEKTSANENSIKWLYILSALVGFIIGIIICILSLPYIIYRYFLYKSNTSNTNNEKAYYVYTAAMFYFHQLSYGRKDLPILQYAEKVIDVTFNTHFTNFLNVYLKIKYTNTSLNEQDMKTVNSFLLNYRKEVQTIIPWQKRFMLFLNTITAIQFFTQAKTNQ